MLSPDPVTQAPENGQNYNRYTYAFNNPLKYTDPSWYQNCGGPDDEFCTEDEDWYGALAFSGLVSSFPSSSGEVGGGGSVSGAPASSRQGVNDGCVGGLALASGACTPSARTGDTVDDSSGQPTQRMRISTPFSIDSEDGLHSALIGNGWDGVTDVTFFGSRRLDRLDERVLIGGNINLLHEQIFGVVITNGQPDIVNVGFMGPGGVSTDPFIDRGEWGGI
jgi:hypothetical protein